MKRKLTGDLETTDLALGYYELEEGESAAFGYHAHGAQGEVFYVLRGTITVRTELGDGYGDRRRGRPDTAGGTPADD